MTSSSNSKPDSLPFPRPLGKPSHRRTQSSSLLPTRSTTSSSSSTTKPLNRHQHTRSKSWLSNWLSKPTTTSATTTNESSSNTKNITRIKSNTGSTSRKKVLLKDIVNSEPVVVVKGIKHARDSAPPSIPTSSSGVYSKPRKPSTSTVEQEEDLVKRLASWDWDGGEHLSKSFNDDDKNESSEDTTLEIIKLDLREEEEEVVEGDQSLGTVWKGFLAETTTRALSPTSTSPPLPPIPFQQRHGGNTEEEEEGEEEISFLSLASGGVQDSSLAISTTSTTTTSDNLSLSYFPSPSGGEISFSDPFRFSNHLYSSSSSSPALLPPPPALVHQSLLNIRSPSQCSSNSTTLAERRSKPVPSPLRIETESSLPRNPLSRTTSIISESVYSRDDDDDHEDYIREEGRGEISLVVGRERSYFSPISPSPPKDDRPFSFSSSPRPLPLPKDEVQYPSSSSPFSNIRRQPIPPPERELFQSSSTRNPLLSSTSTSTSATSSSSSTSANHSLLFDHDLLVAPPSSTFDNEDVEKFGNSNHHHYYYEQQDRVTKGEGAEGEEEEEEEEGKTINPRRKVQRVSGWREDWGFNVVASVLDSEEEKKNPESDLESEEQETLEHEQEEEEEDLSEGEVEKRISLHGQRELERRALERKERWKEERKELYGEPIDAEYEFGLAL